MSINQNTTVSTWYDRDRARIRLHGDIENSSIFALCDEINLAVDYYHYRSIVIEIDSNGGALTSLEYYLRHLNRWRREKNVRISTLAMTTTASAAAMILSLGDIGHRRAYYSSRLLYHQARVLVHRNETWTQNQLEEYRKQLRENDARLLDYLTRYNYEGKIAGEIERDGTPKWRSMLTVRPEAGQMINMGDPMELFVEIDSGDAPHLSFEQIHQAYQALFRLDVFITPEIARRMFLIDEVLTDTMLDKGETR